MSPVKRAAEAVGPDSKRLRVNMPVLHSDSEATSSGDEASATPKTADKKAALVLKSAVDPQRLMNPKTLGLD